MSRLFLGCGVLVIFLAFLQGCTLNPPIQKTSIQESYTGPVASVTDSAIPDSQYKGLLFGLVEIDGKPIDNAFEATRRSAQANATPFRKIEAGFCFIRECCHSDSTGPTNYGKTAWLPRNWCANSRDFRALSGEFNSIEGDVEFSPEPNHEYVVTGILSSNHTSVWIEDSATGEPVTKKVQRDQ